MKFILFPIRCVLLVVILGTSDVGGESCLPPSRSHWANVDLSDPKVQEIAKFAVEKFPNLGKLISVDCLGELKQPDAENIYKIMLVTADDPERPSHRVTCEIDVQGQTAFPVSCK